jgi:hypothetical protein
MKWVITMTKKMYAYDALIKLESYKKKVNKINYYRFYLVI